MDHPNVFSRQAKTISKSKTVEDSQLKKMSADVITRARDGVGLDDLLIEAFALVREASRRVLGLGR